MQSIHTRKPLIIALGAAFALTGAVANASVFQTSAMSSGYMVASADDAKPAGDAKTGEAKCGEKKAEHKCGEKKAGEAKCGEKGSNCEKGAKAGECMCGAQKGKKADGKCGEGKCGSTKKK